MKLCEQLLTATKSELVKTEILFFIAKAKTDKSDLLKITISADNDALSQKMANFANTYLKKEKSSKKIQLFIKSEEIDNQSAESRYLRNKFPEISELNREEMFFLVKI